MYMISYFNLILKIVLRRWKSLYLLKQEQDRDREIRGLQQS